jgi:formate-nitrite transporter family protein
MRFCPTAFLDTGRCNGPAPWCTVARMQKHSIATLNAAKIDEKADRVEETTTPLTPVIYETVRRSGEQEMSRPSWSLAWSGVAAGLSISFSLLAQAILRQHLPDAPWRELVAALGYPVGFVMVVLARQQLFTESTITVILPLIAQPTRRHFLSAGRLWAIVLSANLVGTGLAALFCALTPVLDPPLLEQMHIISRHAMAHEFWPMLLRGVGAGYLMAATVWLMPAAGPAQFQVVVLMTYLIGVGGFAHIVAGSLEAYLLLLSGELGPAAALSGFALPALLGNIIGGSALFAMMAYAQVRHEIKPDAQQEPRGNNA